MSRVFDAAPTTVKGDQITGGAGAVPPPHAPREVAVGLEGVIAGVPAEKRGNELELKPLPQFKNEPLAGAALIAAVGSKRAKEIEAQRARASGSPATTPVAAPAPAPAPVAAVATALAAAPAPAPPTRRATVSTTPTPRQMRGKRPAVETAKTESQPLSTAGAGQPVAAAAPPVATAEPEAFDERRAPNYSTAVDFVSPDRAAMTPEERDGVISLGPKLPHQKAASDTDSPSRGIPKAITDPGKKITGGFGSALEAQYFPLDGLELKTLCEALLSELHARLQDDLRFSMALTYPRVRAKVQLIIEGVGNDQDFVVPVVRLEAPSGKPGSTPLSVALEYGDQITFVVEAKREEFDEAGNSILPPDGMRDQMGVTGPRKQAVRTAIGHSIVDVVTLSR